MNRKKLPSAHDLKYALKTKISLANGNVMLDSPKESWFTRLIRIIRGLI